MGFNNRRCGKCHTLFSFWLNRVIEFNLDRLNELLEVK